MIVLSNSKRSYVLILSIVVLTSLLMVLVLTYILKPALSIAETVKADIVAWSMPRPENHISDVIDIVEWINSSYEDSNCGLLSDFSVLVAGYYEEDPYYPAYWDDYVKMRLDTETSISTGHIHSINISSSHADGTGCFKFHLYAQVQTENLQISVYNSASDEQHSAFIHQPRTSLSHVF